MPEVTACCGSGCGIVVFCGGLGQRVIPAREVDLIPLGRRAYIVHGFKRGRTVKGVGLDLGNTLGDDHSHKAVTAVEGSVADHGNAVGNGDLGNALAPIKGTRADIGDISVENCTFTSAQLFLRATFQVDIPDSLC